MFLVKKEIKTVRNIENTNEEMETPNYLVYRLRLSQLIFKIKSHCPSKTH